jgi:uncharacterized protein YggU (UPF0235/DUF167 family)
MKLHIIAKTKARIPEIKKIDANTYAVSVHEAPVDGKANSAIIGLLSGYLYIPPSRIKLLSGRKSKHKYFEI